MSSSLTGRYCQTPVKALSLQMQQAIYRTEHLRLSIGATMTIHGRGSLTVIMSGSLYKILRATPMMILTLAVQHLIVKKIPRATPMMILTPSVQYLIACILDQT